MLARSSTISELNLNGNPLKTEGSMLVAEMLSKNESLTHLDIGRYFFELRILTNMQAPWHIFWLEFVGNVEMGTESIIALMTVLQSNRSLIYLNIENPRIVKQLQVSLDVISCLSLRIKFILHLKGGVDRSYRTNATREWKLAVVEYCKASDPWLGSAGLISESPRK